MTDAFRMKRGIENRNRGAARGAEQNKPIEICRIDNSFEILDVFAEGKLNLIAIR